jgi:hypothetical protein
MLDQVSGSYLSSQFEMNALSGLCIGWALLGQIDKAFACASTAHPESLAPK